MEGHLEKAQERLVEWVFGMFEQLGKVTEVRLGTYSERMEREPEGWPGAVEVLELSRGEESVLYPGQ
jgi:hypothetical protein